ncbi:hypothetical protein [Candidatus Palauibacter sp.]|uniref:hypothetical protein n=1 Tax=Candidatus Palauibacter sp. TaxID=3101350 RepID=UPI003C6ECC1E
MLHRNAHPRQRGLERVPETTGPLEESANGLVPGSVLQPGVEMVIEVDPDTTVTLSLGVHERIPETGRLALEVHDMRPLNLLLIDDVTGAVRGFLRDLPVVGGEVAADGPEPGLRMQVSRGVPERQAWRR